MNLNDLRANAYNINKNNIKKEDNNKQNIQNKSDQSQEHINVNKVSKSSNPQLDSATDYLKSGGLIKVPIEQSGENGEDSVYRRVAKFLVLIGEDEAAKVLPHLEDSQIEKIIPEIASIRTVSKDEAAVIMAEFQGLLKQSRQSGGVETAREILEKAYGKDKAQRMMENSIPFEGKKPFEYFSQTDKEKIYILLKDESVAVKSLVLSNLEPKKAASVINLMSDAEKKEVVLRLAKMESVSPDVIKRVDNAMYEKSLSLNTEKAENIDGRNALAQILKKMDSNAESDIIKYLSEDDPDLGEDLRNRLFTMEDVINCDDRFIQDILRTMSEREICLIIVSKPEDFREKLLKNVSTVRRQEILEQEDLLKPFRKSDCQSATSQFFSVLRRAFEDGRLYVKDRNDDIYI